MVSGGTNVPDVPGVEANGQVRSDITYKRGSKNPGIVKLSRFGRDGVQRARLHAAAVALRHCAGLMGHAGHGTRARIKRIPPGSAEPDPVLLKLFNNLLMNVAEQMGAVLQNTSLSVNIKERLDFSCAVFDAEGGLVSNAPHIPIHLGDGRKRADRASAAARDVEAGRRGHPQQPL
jgi:hypothetical protein